MPNAPDQFVITSNLHLAALLATVGAKPREKIIDGTKTPDGNPIVKWTFESDAIAEETIAMWQNPGNFRKEKAIVPVRDWNQMSHEEKAMAINVLSAFTCNLKFFLQGVKKS